MSWPNQTWLKTHEYPNHFAEMPSHSPPHRTRFPPSSRGESVSSPDPRRTPQATAPNTDLFGSSTTRRLDFSDICPVSSPSSRAAPSPPTRPRRPQTGNHRPPPPQTASTPVLSSSQTPSPAPAPWQPPSPSPLEFSFQQQNPPLPQQQQQQQQQQAGWWWPWWPQQQAEEWWWPWWPPLVLWTAEGKPAEYNTRWEELHTYSHNLLLQIEDKIREYRDESERLDHCTRLYDSSMTANSFELNASRIKQELGHTSTIMNREKLSVPELAVVNNDMMQNTQFAMHSYKMMRLRFIHPHLGIANAGPTSYFYSGVPKRPSPFMQHSVARFEKYLGECCKWIGQLEQHVRIDTSKTSSNYLESLPKVVSNVHGYFIYVASEVENIHQYVESIKTQYLNDQRRKGNGNDPFLEANRREVAKQEAASRRIHPTLHLSAAVWQPTQIAARMISLPQQCPFPSATFSSACSTFGIEASALLSLTFHFCTIATPAPSTNLFASARSVQQPAPFGTASTLTPGSTLATSTLGTGIPSFASTPAMSDTSLISTQPGGGKKKSNSSSGGPSKGKKARQR